MNRRLISMFGAALLSLQGLADVTASNFKLTGPNNGGVTLSWTVSGAAGGGMFGGMFYANGTYNVAVTRGTSASQSAQSRTIVAGETSGAYMQQTGNSGQVTDTPPATGQTYYYWLHYAPYSIIDVSENFFACYLGGSYSTILSASCIGPISVFIPAPGPTKFTVTFNSNDGKGDTTDQEFEKGVPQALKKNGFSRSGYEFQGWSTTEDGGVGYEDEQEVSIDADLMLYAVWKKNKLKLTASDGTVPGGIEVEWTDDGTEQYALYRALSEDGPFTNIATVATNVYFDTSVEWGQPYWYFVNRASGQKRGVRLRAGIDTNVPPFVGEPDSNTDDGNSMSDGELPKITDVDVGELWLTGEGPYYCFLTWNDFNKDKYYVSSISFDLIRADSGESVWKSIPKKVLSHGDQIEVFDVAEIGGETVPKGKHGQHKLMVTWEVSDRATGKFLDDDKQPGNEPSACDDVKVFFHKYDMEGGIPNWFRYWPRDGAIFNLFGKGSPEQWDGLFRFDSSLGSTLGEHTGGGNDEKIAREPEGFPPIYRLAGYRKHRYKLGIDAAGHGETIDPSNPRFSTYTGPRVGSSEVGVKNIAAVMAHELKHGSIENELRGMHYMRGWLFIGKRKTNYNLQSSLALIQALDEAGYNSGIQHLRYRDYYDTIVAATSQGEFTADFDGDGVSDVDENGGRYGSWGFSSLHPDTKNFASFHPDYARMGDNEVLARDAEKGGDIYVLGMECRDWAWPGYNIADKTFNLGSKIAISVGYVDSLTRGNMMFLFNADWSRVRHLATVTAQKMSRKTKNDMSDKIANALKRSVISNLLKRSFAVNSSEAVGASIGGQCHGVESTLPEVSVTTGELYVATCTSVDAVRDAFDRIMAFDWSIAVTNAIDETMAVKLRCCLTDESTNALAWAVANVECAAGITTLEMRFNAEDIFLRSPSRLMLYAVTIESSDGDMAWTISEQTPCALTAQSYSPSDIANDKGRIIPSSVGVNVSADGVTVSGKVVRVSGEAAQIYAMLTDTNGHTVTSAMIEAPGAGTNNFSILFSGEEIYRLARPLPYVVESVRLVENGTSVHEIETAGTVNAEDAYWFRPADLTIHAITGSGAWSGPLRGADGLCSQITYSFMASNAENAVKFCHAKTTLLGTNEEHVCSLNLPVALSPGTNVVSMPFSSISIRAHDYDGGIYHIGNVFIETDNDNGIEVLHTDGNGIAVAKSDFGGIPLLLEGAPVFRRATGKSPAALLVPLDVARPDTITASVMLTDGDGKYVAMARTNETVAVGERTLTLTFDPDAITASGRRGPYTISYLLLKSGIEGVEDVRIEDFKMLNVAESAFRAFVDLSDIVTTETTPVPVERTWLDDYPTMLETFSGDYEDMANATSPGASGSGKTWPDGSPCRVWQDYVAGTSPTNNDVFSASIRMDGATPVVEWKPDTPELRATRIYRTLGKKTLLDTNWTDITGKDQSEYHFFKVSVEMP